MSAPAAPVPHIIAAAGAVLLALATAVWRQLRGFAGRAAATRAVIVAFVASAVMWAALIEMVRLLVRAVLR